MTYYLRWSLREQAIVSCHILLLSDVYGPVPTHNAPYCLRGRSSWPPQAASSAGRCLGPDPGPERSDLRRRRILLVIDVVLFDSCGSPP